MPTPSPSYRAYFDRSPDAVATIAKMRMMRHEEGATDVGTSLMWLEDRLCEAWAALGWRIEDGKIQTPPVA